MDGGRRRSRFNSGGLTGEKFVAHDLVKERFVNGLDELHADSVVPPVDLGAADPEIRSHDMEIVVQGHADCRADGETRSAARDIDHLAGVYRHPAEGWPHRHQGCGMPDCEAFVTPLVKRRGGKRIHCRLRHASCSDDRATRKAVVRSCRLSANGVLPDPGKSFAGTLEAARRLKGEGQFPPANLQSIEDIQ
ncbi:hypothetical protein AOX55_0000948 [Sinorhizobium fredii CCBAU 25509]|nr:hypothetical protein AOX55_0000948 [Sinorhizobium fredii CCBAU 25509]